MFLQKEHKNGFEKSNNCEKSILDSKMNHGRIMYMFICH